MANELVTTQNKSIAKVPPQSTDAEIAVLGGLMVNDEAIVRVVELLTPDSFYKKSHAEIYASILDLFNNSEPIDIITVSENLRDKDKLDFIGGRAYINDLAMEVVTTANIEYYAKIVQEKASLRDLIKAGTDIVRIAYEEQNVDNTLDNAEKMIFSIAQKKVKDDLTHVRNVVNKSFEQIEQRYNNKDELTGSPSGFYDLDAMTAGFQKSDLVIVAARPAMGKTAFCLNIAQHMATRANLPVAMFSLEMSKEQLVQRMLCAEAEIDSTRIRTGNMQSDDWGKLTQAMGSLADAPIFIDDSPGCSVMDIRAKCRRLCMEHKDLSMIIIDYLQLMEGTGKTENRTNEISAISRGLKNLARELNVTIIALSQLSRAVESRTIKKPMLSDLRESGSIEQDADMVMFLYREEYYEPDNADNKGKATVIIAKQRSGPVGEVELLWQGSITKFKNPTTKTTSEF